jgi:hypothetical protein
MPRAKQLPDGGFPLERPNARAAREVVTRGTWADWGPSGRRTSNPLVTAAAQWILAPSEGSRSIDFSRYI